MARDWDSGPGRAQGAMRHRAGTAELSHWPQLIILSQPIDKSPSKKASTAIS